MVCLRVVHTFSMLAPTGSSTAGSVRETSLRAVQGRELPCRTTNLAGTGETMGAEDVRLPGSVASVSRGSRRRLYTPRTVRARTPPIAHRGNGKMRGAAGRTARGSCSPRRIKTRGHKSAVCPVASSACQSRRSCASACAVRRHRVAAFLMGQHCLGTLRGKPAAHPVGDLTLKAVTVNLRIDLCAIHLLASSARVSMTTRRRFLARIRRIFKTG